MTTIVERDAAIAHRFSDAAGAAEYVDSIEQVKLHLDNRPQEFVVILGPSVPLAAAVSLASTLRVTRPALGVILVRDVVDTTVLAEALRAGMREVIPQTDLSAIAPAVQRSRTLHEAMLDAAPGDRASESKGKVVTVFSAKGGVGKTTVSTNLAVALADGDKNQVCLVDLDLSFGDVAIALQIFPTRTIADTVPMQAHLDIQALESLLTPYRDGVFALAAPVQPDAKDSISPQLVRSILGLLRERFAYVVIDTPPALDDQVLQAFDESDLIVLVATPDIPALKNLKIACETISLLNIDKDRLRVVLNRADSRVGISPAEVAASVNMTITTSVPSSRDVPATINRGELIYLADRRHAVSQAIAHLAKAVVTGTTASVVPVAAEPSTNGASAKGAPASHSRRKSSLFGRREARA